MNREEVDPCSLGAARTAASAPGEWAQPSRRSLMGLDSTSSFLAGVVGVVLPFLNTS
jgi:hypothetical protein